MAFGQSTFSSRILDKSVATYYYGYYGVLFFGKSADINPSDPKSFLFQTCFYNNTPNPNYITQATSGTGIANFNVNKLLLQSAGFASGEKVYCVSCFGNRFILRNYYTDPQSGMIIFPGFSPYHSEVKSFILP